MSGATDATAPIAVIGIGNVLMGDDGFGPSVIELLRVSWDFPASVELIDAGTPSLNLVTLLHGRDVVLLIDAVNATGQPGEMRLYHGDDLLKLPPKPRVSPHDPAVQEALCIAELAGSGPRQVLLIGAIPESLDMSTELSAAVRAATSTAAALVVQELARCGAAATPIVEPKAPDAWWMREPGPTACVLSTER